jgi:type II secretory pathway component PulJ
MTRLRSRRRAGFTVVELAVTSFLMALVAVLLSATWVAFCRPAIDAAVRCRLAQEASLAAASLARDYGGTLAGAGGSLGAKTDGQFVGRMVPDPGQLSLCFHGGGSSADFSPKWTAPDTVITYYLASNQLIRWDQGTGTVFAAARDVSAFQVAPLEDGTGVTIVLTFSHRGLNLTYTLIAYDPPKPS